MKKKWIFLVVILFIILIIIILSLFFPKLESVNLKKFIDNYNILLQEKVDSNISIKYPTINDRNGATYYIYIKDSFYLGIASNNIDGELNLENDNISASLIRYDKNIDDYTEANKYLYYLIKINNDKLSQNEINELIKEIRTNPSSSIRKFNLIIKHNSSDSNYQFDSIGRVEK